MRILLISLLLIPSFAFAQGVESAVSITEKECKKLIRMNSFSGADYVPGVDVRGNKVVGADLNGGYKLDLPKEITFDLGIDLAERYGWDKGVSGTAKIGTVKVKGRNVYWNGKKLGQGENDAVLDACLQQYGQK